MTRLSFRDEKILPENPTQLFLANDSPIWGIPGSEPNSGVDSLHFFIFGLFILDLIGQIGPISGLKEMGHLMPP